MADFQVPTAIYTLLSSAVVSAEEKRTLNYVLAKEKDWTVLLCLARNLRSVDFESRFQSVLILLHIR